MKECSYGVHLVSSPRRARLAAGFINVKAVDFSSTCLAFAGFINVKAIDFSTCLVLHLLVLDNRFE